MFNNSRLTPPRSRQPTLFCTPMKESIEIDIDLPSTVDALLQGAFDDEIQPPKAILDLIPSPTITVSSVLQNDLPAILRSSAVNLQSAESCTTNHMLCWTIEELFKAPIPPREWLGDLEIIVKKKWFARARVTSIHHPTISSLCLPLWVGNFWYSLTDVTEQKEKWSRAERWVSNQVQDESVYEARNLMVRIPWGARIWALAGADSASFVGVLAGLLSTDWLSERRLDTLASYLNFRASRDRTSVRECWVGDVYLSMCIKNVYRAARKTVNDNLDLKKYQAEINAHGYKHLFFPANLNGRHWIVFKVDLTKREFCYGTLYNSLSMDTRPLTKI